MGDIDYLRWIKDVFPRETSGRFVEYCNEMHIPHKIHEIGDAVEIECYMNVSQMEKANAFIVRENLQP